MLYLAPACLSLSLLSLSLALTECLEVPTRLVIFPLFILPVNQGSV
jgi:hypothetical protein